MHKPSYYLAHVGVRNLKTDLEKASFIFINFKEKDKMTQKDICDFFNIDPHRLQKGVWNMLNGIPLGENHGSKLLLQSKTDELIKMAIEKEKQHQPFTIDEIAKEVILFY